ncbi:MAG TPA: heavy metal-associated domain-containing protein [Bacteroidia bacterium]|nr:heavy metal-associated domain-containing protein [Bacteroidia bacterium]
MQNTYFLTGMTCDNCVAKIKSALLKLPDVVSAEVKRNPDVALIEMSRDISLPDLQQAISPEKKYVIHDGVFPVSFVNEKETDRISFLKTYKPLLIIFIYITAVSFIAARNYYGFNLMAFMTYFMAGFFLVFSFFKFLDLKGFADGYSTYDLLAKKWKPYGFIYPFIELAFGVWLLKDVNHHLAYIFIAVVMSFSLLGVINSLRKKQVIECACLGTIFKVPLGTVTLVEDFLMVMMSVASLVIVF